MQQLLFSYGTLQSGAVQQSTFGRLLKGEQDAIVGFRLSSLEIKDEAVVALSGERFHPVLTPTGDPADQVPGMAFEVEEADLLQADQYEVADYKRILAVLRSGREAWLYVRQDT